MLVEGWKYPFIEPKILVCLQILLHLTPGGLFLDEVKQRRSIILKKHMASDTYCYHVPLISRKRTTAPHRRSYSALEIRVNGFSFLGSFSTFRRMTNCISSVHISDTSITDQDVLSVCLSWLRTCSEASPAGRTYRAVAGGLCADSLTTAICPPLSRCWQRYLRTCRTCQVLIIAHIVLVDIYTGHTSHTLRLKH